MLHFSALLVLCYFECLFSHKKITLCCHSNHDTLLFLYFKVQWMFVVSWIRQANVWDLLYHILCFWVHRFHELLLSLNFTICSCKIENTSYFLSQESHFWGRSIIHHLFTVVQINPSTFSSCQEFGPLCPLTHARSLFYTRKWNGRPKV